MTTPDYSDEWQNSITWQNWFPKTPDQEVTHTTKLQDFSMILFFFQIPWFFQIWKTLLSFSRFSMIQMLETLP